MEIKSAAEEQASTTDHPPLPTPMSPPPHTMSAAPSALSRQMSQIEWDELVKPAIYVLELILGAVVTFSTADTLLYTSPTTSSIARCALNDSVPTCAAVISVGSVCLLGGLYVLWRRLTAAFEADYFQKVDESGFCALLSVGWLIVASIISANLTLPADDSARFRSTRNVNTAFSWINAVAHAFSAVLAAYKPFEDMMAQETHLEYVPEEDSGSGERDNLTSADLLFDSGHSGERDEKLEEVGLRKFNPFGSANLPGIDGGGVGGARRRFVPGSGEGGAGRDESGAERDSGQSSTKPPLMPKIGGGL